MASQNLVRTFTARNLLFKSKSNLAVLGRGASTTSGQDSKAKKASPKQAPQTAAPVDKVPSYNSKATPTSPAEPVGPGASKTGDYKNAEYFCYNSMSYFDLEVEMVKDRLPQPTAGNEHY